MITVSPGQAKEKGVNIPNEIAVKELARPGRAPFPGHREDSEGIHNVIHRGNATARQKGAYVWRVFDDEARRRYELYEISTRSVP
jgi:hypothetical protein